MTKDRTDLYLFFPYGLPLLLAFIVCAEVIKMAVVQDEILDAFIMELRERALSEFRRNEKENAPPPVCWTQS